MKKRELRIVVIITTIVVLICLSSQYKITKSKTDSQNMENEISLFRTRNEQEYLEFLKNFSSKFEILGITTIMDTYARPESYVVTYRKENQKEKGNEQKYEYFVFKTRDRQQFEEMHDELNLDEVEIINISVIQGTYARGDSYMITYRKKVA